MCLIWFTNFSRCTVRLIGRTQWRLNLVNIKIWVFTHGKMLWIRSRGTLWQFWVLIMSWETRHRGYKSLHLTPWCLNSKRDGMSSKNCLPTLKNATCRVISKISCIWVSSKVIRVPLNLIKTTNSKMHHKTNQSNHRLLNYPLIGVNYFQLGKLMPAKTNKMTSILKINQRKSPAGPNSLRGSAFLESISGILFV